MNYQEAMKYMEKAGRRGSVYGLTTMKYLLEELNHPENQLEFIHVGGTNGKGSVCAFLTSVLVRNNKKVGRYLSPAVFSYREKIQYVTSKTNYFMTEHEVVWSLEKVILAIERMKEKGLNEPTAFEIETAMAFLLFVKWQVDIVVLEVGLGGKSDATNVVQNVLATVITPISMDHMQILGNNILEIAKEKSGIIKKNHHVFTFQKNAVVEQCLQEKAAEMSAEFTSIRSEDAKLEEASIHGTRFSYKGKTYKIGMAGLYQMENAMLAIEVCEKMKLSHVKEGIEFTSWAGRFEVLQTNPMVIFDGAHNEAGAKALAESIEKLLPNKKIYGLFGVFKDKEYEKIAAQVVPHLSMVWVTKGEGKRGLSPEILKQTCKNYCDKVYLEEDAGEAFLQIKKKVGPEDVILAFGSLSFLSKLL